MQAAHAASDRRRDCSASCIAGSDAQQNSTFYRDATGWTTRANFGFDFASNTAYGPLIGHFDINAELGNGFDNTGTGTYLNTGYLTWAGITAGKAPSFFSFVGGGDNWANFFSPDRKGFNQPNLLAYTASFGGGFSATLSAESPARHRRLGRRHRHDRRRLSAPDHLRRRALARHRRRPALQAGLGRGSALRRDARRQRR